MRGTRALSVPLTDWARPRACQQADLQRLSRLQVIQPCTISKLHWQVQA